MLRKFGKDVRGFTGLEAAIVLIAFVTVAAVFSYVMLGAGFFATQKSKQVVHTGISEASSSLELDGQYIYLKAINTGSNGEVRMTDFMVTLTAGNAKVDMNKLTLAYRDEDDYVQIPFTQFLIINGSLNCGGDNLGTNYYAVINFESSSDLVTGTNGYVPKIKFYNVNDQNKNCTYTLGSYSVTANVNKTSGVLDNATITPSSYTNVFLPFWYYKSVVGNEPHNIIEGSEKFQIVADLLLMAAKNTTDINVTYRFNATALSTNNAKIYLVKLDTSSYRVLNVEEYTGPKITDPPGTSEDITIELKPSVGAPLVINKETPPSLESTSYV